MRKFIKRDRFGKMAPLRKVVEYVREKIGEDEFYEYTATREKLECGHIIPIRQDFYGEVSATRRRCNQCLEEKEKEDEAIQG